MIDRIPLDKIRLDGGTQPRKHLDTDAVDEYAEIYRLRAAELPELEAVLDGSDYWLWDGFHRYHGAQKAGLVDVPCKIRKGTVKEARWLAAGANRKHGLKRTNEDKRLAAEMALREHPEMSDSAIADHVGIDGKTVASVRAELELTSEVPKSKTRTGRDGRNRKTPKTPKQPNKSESTSELPRLSTTAEPSPMPKPYADGASPATVPTVAPTDEQEDEPVPEEVCLDGWGIPIQPHAQEAFAAVEEFNRLLGLLKEVKSDLTALVDSPGGQHLMRQCQWVKGANKAGGRWSLSHLDNAIATIESARPHVTDCPYAHIDQAPHGEDCPLCHNLCWLGNPKGHQIPPTLTKAMKDHYGLKEEK